MPLSLKFAVGIGFPNSSPTRWRGCSAEHVSVPPHVPYEFSHQGDLHYLALHDIRLTDGELNVDTLPTIRSRDLRNTLTFVPKGCAISGWAKAEPRSSFTALYFDPTQLHDELQIRYTRRSPAPAVYVRDPSLQATLRKIQALVTSHDGDPLHAETLCLTAALEVLGVSASPQAGRLSAAQMEQVREFIDSFIDRPINLSDLAGSVGLSRFHFCRAFKATTGQTPYRFVARLRVEAASRLLASSTLAVDQIAAAVGFNSAAQFRRAFQEFMGVTPLVYRRSQS